MTDDGILAFLVDHEGPGDRVNPDATDRGGETHYGFTWPTFSAVTGGTLEQFRALTRAQAMRAYQSWLFATLRLGEIHDARLKLALADFAVNSGPVAAVKALQRAVGVTPVDGICGTRTIVAANSAVSAARVLERVIASRLRLLAGTAEIRGIKRGGWFQRIADVLEAE